jgi:hypothetical protein
MEDRSSLFCLQYNDVTLDITVAVSLALYLQYIERRVWSGLIWLRIGASGWALEQ